MYNEIFNAQYTSECGSEGILKLGEWLAKMWTRIADVDSLGRFLPGHTQFVALSDYQGRETLER